MEQKNPKFLQCLQNTQHNTMYVFIITEQTHSKVEACNNFFHITINFRNRHIAEGEEEEFEDDDEDDTVDYSKS